jgi:hypothetical protein
MSTEMFPGIDSIGRLKNIAHTGRTATYVIAASDSSATAQAQADTTITAGVNIATAVNAAIAALASYGGGKIHFCATPTQYTVSTPILYTDNIIFEGEGWNSSVLKLADGANCNMFERTGELTTENFFNQWRDLCLHGNDANNTSGSGIFSGAYIHDVVVENCFILNFKDYGIYMDRCWNINITKNILEFCGTAAYLANTGQDLRIVNNKFLYNVQGIYNYGSDILIEGNWFYHLNTQERTYDINNSYGANIRIIANDFFGEGASNYNSIILIKNTSGPLIITSNNFNGRNKAAYAILNECSAWTLPNVITNNSIINFRVKPYLFDKAGYRSLDLIANNIGWIAPGEIRTHTFNILAADLDQNDITSIDNPFGQDVRLLSLDFASSVASSAGAIIAGLNSSVVDSTNLFSDLPCNTAAPAFYRSTIAYVGSQTLPKVWKSGSGNRYLNVSIKYSAATGLVCTLTATVMGN